MQIPKLQLNDQGVSSQWGGVPSGLDALVFGNACVDLQKHSGKHLPVMVLRDNAQLESFAKDLSYFSPDLSVLQFPAWDTVPYDRISPAKELMSRRLKTLMSLDGIKTSLDCGGACLLTTAAALGQYVLPSSALRGMSLSFKVGEEISAKRLQTFFMTTGYHAVEVVREGGEYALRGGIIDIFPSHAPAPFRLDLFGDEIEKIRIFDPLTQQSTGESDAVSILPASEVILTPETQRLFRQKYIQAFGVQASEDSLLQDIAHGIGFSGQENWMPHFYGEMQPLWAWISHPLWFFDHQVVGAVQHFLDQAADHYAARHETLLEMQRARAIDSAYRPVPLNEFYMPQKSFNAYFQEQGLTTFSPFVTEGAANFGGVANPLKNALQTPSKEKDKYKRLQEYLDKTDRPVIFSGLTEGSVLQMTSLLSHQMDLTLRPVKTWKTAEKKCKSGYPIVVSPLQQGFRSEKFDLVTEHDVFGKTFASKTRSGPSKNLVLELGAFEVDDFLVHREYGIGLFRQLITLEVNGAEHDCVLLEYDKGDKLYVPVENLDLLSKYASKGSTATVDRLGALGWQKRTAVVKKRIKEIAGQLLKIAAERAERRGIQIESITEVYDEFCAEFPYEETEDQLRAIKDVLSDLMDVKPMDRLICGDVGFGKTEVALRGAFLTALAGYQVVLVVPTTILCRQHFKTFQERLKNFGMNVAQLSRFITPAQERETLRALKAGEVNILIATHGIFSAKAKFHNLGLIIIDEEQHFGVLQKEYLKELKSDVNLLAMSATPIPRTLQMAISGVRELSLIATPPMDRMAVKSFVMPFDKMIIREAILREYHRGGQVYFVCPRVADLRDIGRTLKTLVPEISMTEAHGQMPMRKLDETMQDFYDGKYTVLLATNIVESGLDVPKANTMIIHRADMFGLSQLYQLRGRIGRSKVRGYAYLLLPQGRTLQKKAERRLEVMQSLDKLGAGFTVASHDMDIRGAGNLVGSEQSGHIKEVGVELYQHMLQEAIDNLKPEAAEKVTTEFSPQINLGLPTLIPEKYVLDLSVRISLYRRLSDVQTFEELVAFKGELQDRFGTYPMEVENLMQVIELKILARQLNISKLEAGPKGVVFKFHKNHFQAPEKLLAYIHEHAGMVKLRPDHALVLLRAWGDIKDRIEGIKQFLTSLGRILSDEK